MNYQRKVVLIILGLFFFFSFPVSVLAAELSASKSSLGVSPAIIEEVLAPGEEKKTEVWVLNITDFPLPIKTNRESFVVQADILKETDQTFNASSWLKVNPQGFILSAHDKKKIEIIIDVPSSAEPGGHYAIVYFQPLVPSTKTKPQTAYLSAKVGVLMFLTVKGEIIEQADFQDFQTASFSQFGPLDFSLSFQNRGNIHLLPSGQVIIKNFWGKEVGKMFFDSQVVLPRTEKEIKMQWNKKFLLGRFSAQAYISYGSRNVKLESQPISFWVIPWLPFVILTLVFGLCIVLRRRLILALKVLFRGDLNKIMKKYRKGVKRKK